MRAEPRYITKPLVAEETQDLCRLISATASDKWIFPFSRERTTTLIRDPIWVGEIAVEATKFPQAVSRKFYLAAGGQVANSGFRKGRVEGTIVLTIESYFDSSFSKAIPFWASLSFLSSTCIRPLV